MDSLDLVKHIIPNVEYIYEYTTPESYNFQYEMGRFDLAMSCEDLYSRKDKACILCDEIKSHRPVDTVFFITTRYVHLYSWEYNLYVKRTTTCEQIRHKYKERKRRDYSLVDLCLDYFINIDITANHNKHIVLTINVMNVELTLYVKINRHILRQFIKFICDNGHIIDDGYIYIETESNLITFMLRHENYVEFPKYKFIDAINNPPLLYRIMFAVLPNYECVL